jgi:hypothetical protein
MLTFLITLLVLLTIVAIMAVGVMMGRKPISGSCGGVGAALGEANYSCDICGGDPNKCDESQDPAPRAKGTQLGYDAGRQSAG